MGNCLGRILKHWCWIICLDREEPIKQSCEWLKSNTGVKSWTMESKDELYTIRLALVRDMIRIVKDRCNNIERQNSLPKFSEKSSLTLCRELIFLWGKELYVEWCSR